MNRGRIVQMGLVSEAAKKCPAGTFLRSRSLVGPRHGAGLPGLILNLSLLLTGCAAPGSPGPTEEWAPLFTGHDLSDWLGDPALWSLEGGVLVGRAAGLKKSSYLCSRAVYRDFELAFDVKLAGDTGANSGVQYRSRLDPARSDPIGYQADIGQTYWGSLYVTDERFGLLAGAAPEVRKRAVRPHDWNRYVVRAHGDRHVLEINDVTTVEARDGRHPQGFFAFQLHAGATMEVRFANARVRRLGGPEVPCPSPLDPEALRLVRAVADGVLRDNPKPPPFDWGEGVLMTGMLDAWDLTRDERYLDFVRRWADHWRKAGLGDILESTPAGGGRVRKAYCGRWGPAYALLELHEITGEPRYQAMADEVIAFLMTRGERTDEGALAHFVGDGAIWCDTLWMVCPVLSNAARIESRPELQRESVKQLELAVARLQDPATGLFHHEWREKTGRTNGQLWARGNGWIALSFTDVLRHEPSDSAAFGRLRDAFERQLRAIAALQDAETGLWHTVLDAPDVYVETSASAMLLYGMLEGRRLGFISGIPPEATRRAWEGLKTRVDTEGRVVGVSGGTGPSPAREAYARVKTGAYTWGTGAFLMAARALQEDAQAGAKR